MRVIAGVFTKEVCAVWWFAFGTVESEGSVDFVGGDMVEPARDSHVAALLRMTRREALLRMTEPAKRFPAEACGLKEGEGAHYVGPGKCERILYGTVNVGLGCKMYDAVYFFIFHKLADGFKVADVKSYELVVRFILDILKIGKVTGVSKLIDIYYAIVRVLVYQQPYYVATYESGSAGYEDGSVHYNRLRRY